MNGLRYKCNSCYHILKEEDVIDGACPECNTQVVKMCERDHTHCHHEIIETLAYCPECGAACCPICESHDVMQISRITGYLQSVDGWNRGKAQELKDRVHYNYDGGFSKSEFSES